jgi:hypothetical protein
MIEKKNLILLIFGPYVHLPGESGGGMKIINGRDSKNRFINCIIRIIVFIGDYTVITRPKAAP